MYSRVLILFAALAALANGAVIPRETTTTAVASNIISVPGMSHTRTSSLQRHALS